MRRLLIAGCGDLGMRLAGRLAGSDWRVTGLRRNISALSPPVEPMAADLARPETLSSLAPDWDAVIFQATPDARDEAAYRRIYLDGLSALLERVRTRRLLLVSSTAVYGQDDGSWVDEDSTTRPGGFNGRVLLDSERLALASPHPATIVRFSGIYGPGREFLIRSLQAGRARCRPEPPQWTNRIHADDCAAVLEHLLEFPQVDPLYCASDCHPAPRCEVLDWLAERLGVAPAQRMNPDEAGTGQGKRVSSRRLLASGFSFQYPDFQTGYGALLP